MSSNDFVKVTFGLVFVVVLFVSRRLPRHIIRGDEDSISIEITGASPESANLLSRFLVRVVEKRSKPYYTWPEYQGQINALNAHFVDYNTIPWTLTGGECAALAVFLCMGVFTIFESNFRPSVPSILESGPNFLRVTARFSALIISSVGIFIWDKICCLARWVAYALGWGPNDWLMFRVFYEYFLIDDWDRRTFRHLIRDPVSFWGRIFWGSVRTALIAVPSAIIAGAMFVSDVKFEEVKQAVYKALPLLLIWSMLVISLHIFYPYFVWWPRRILWVDYAILFGVAKVIKGIPAAIKWLFGRPYFAGLTFEDTPDKPDTPGDQGG